MTSATPPRTSSGRSTPPRRWTRTWQGRASARRERGIEAVTEAREGQPADVLCDIAEAYGSDVHRGRQQGDAPQGAGQRPEQRLPQRAVLGGDSQDDVSPRRDLDPRHPRHRPTCSASSRPTRRSTGGDIDGDRRGAARRCQMGGALRPARGGDVPRASRRSGHSWSSSWSRGTTSTRRSRTESCAGTARCCSSISGREGKGSGIEVDSRYAHLWQLSEGEGARVDAYYDRDQALAALNAAHGE